MSKKLGVIAVVRKSEVEDSHRVVCTFDNIKDANDWIDNTYRRGEYYVTPCKMQIVTDSPVPAKSIQFMTAMYDNHFGEGALAIRCTLDEMSPASLSWMKLCVKIPHVPVVYEFNKQGE